VTGVLVFPIDNTHYRLRLDAAKLFSITIKSFLIATSGASISPSVPIVQVPGLSTANAPFGGEMVLLYKMASGSISIPNKVRRHHHQRNKRLGTQIQIAHAKSFKNISQKRWFPPTGTQRTHVLNFEVQKYSLMVTIYINSITGFVKIVNAFCLNLRKSYVLFIFLAFLIFFKSVNSIDIIVELFLRFESLRKLSLTCFVSHCDLNIFQSFMSKVCIIKNLWLKCHWRPDSRWCWRSKITLFRNALSVF